jgi:hypothetical protein
VVLFIKKLFLNSSVLFVQKFVFITGIYDFHYNRIDFEDTYCFDLLKIKTSVQLRVATTMKVKQPEQRENLSRRLERDRSVRWVFYPFHHVQEFYVGNIFWGVWVENSPR